jgi:hypothetical protein
MRSHTSPAARAPTSINSRSRSIFQPSACMAHDDRPPGLGPASKWPVPSQ